MQLSHLRDHGRAGVVPTRHGSSELGSFFTGTGKNFPHDDFPGGGAVSGLWAVADRFKELSRKSVRFDGAGPTIGRRVVKPMLAQGLLIERLEGAAT